MVKRILIEFDEAGETFPIALIGSKYQLTMHLDTP